MAIYSGFSHEKLRFSILMLVYQTLYIPHAQPDTQDLLPAIPMVHHFPCQNSPEKNWGVYSININKHQSTPINIHKHQ